MIKQILYNSDLLEGLFTQKDFEFLKDSNSRQEEMEYELKVAGLKRDKIIESINKMNTNNFPSSDCIELNTRLTNAEKAFKSVNNIITNLTHLLNEFDQIEKDILQVVLKKDANNSLNTDSLVKNIFKKIYTFKEKQHNLKQENYKENLVIDTFLNNPTTPSCCITPEEVSTKPIVTTKILEFPSQVNTVDLEDNLLLRISEKENKVYLPYTKTEIQKFLDNYPEEYNSANDVINEEFIVDISIYNKHPVLARFRESYSLSRNKEMKSAIDSLKFAMEIMFKSNINPTIIAAVKSQQQLEDYIECLEKNKLEDFKHFEIIFEVNPL